MTTITAPNGGIPAAFSRKSTPAKDGLKCAAGLMMVDPKGRVLFVRRTGDDAAGTWALPAGMVEDEEDFADAAVREAREETAIDVGAIEPTPLSRLEWNGVDFAMFAVPIDHPISPILCDESDGYSWGTLSDPPQPLHPGLQSAILQFFKEEAGEREHERSQAAQKIYDRLQVNSGRLPGLTNDAADATAFDRMPKELKDAVATDAALVIAVDRESVRDFDKDSRLHVIKTNISKANVCPYRGQEIPGFEFLGLEPNRIYRLYRDADELKKAAPTFNRLPVLRKHVAVNAKDHKPDEVVGATGSDASFEFPYLTNSLVVWAKDSIDAIESKAQAEISSGYHYRADMTPGEVDGIQYDGVMRDIVGNHIALVETGRVGPDIVVADSMESLMSKPTRIAALAFELTSRAVLPMLAMDQKVNLLPLFNDLTTKNIAQKHKAIVEGVRAHLKGRTIAKDAQLDHIEELLTRLEKAPPEDGDESVSEKQHNAMAAAAAGESNLGIPPKVGEEFMDADKGKTFDEGSFRELLKSKGVGEDDLEEVMSALPKSPAAKDEEEDKDKDKKKVEGEAEDEDDDDKDKDKGKDKAMGKDEMNAAISAAVQAERKRGQEIRVAFDEVRPFVGDLPASLAFDTAGDVYRHSLKMLGVDEADSIKEVPALRAILKLQPRAGAGSNEPSKPAAIATDAASAKSFADFYPDAERIGVA